MVPISEHNLISVNRERLSRETIHFQHRNYAVCVRIICDGTQVEHHPRLIEERVLTGDTRVVSIVLK